METWLARSCHRDVLIHQRHVDGGPEMLEEHFLSPMRRLCVPQAALSLLGNSPPPSPVLLPLPGAQ